MIVDKIGKYLSSSNLKLQEHIASKIGQLAFFAFKKQFMEEEEERKGSLWLSQAGKCPRQLAYKYHGFEKLGKEIDARAKVVFFQGDLIEIMVLQLAKLAGCNISATGMDQMVVAIDINGVEVKGHPDGLLLEEGKVYLVECKSMPSYGFKRFEEGNIDAQYLAQTQMYQYASKIPRTVFVVLNKDNGLLNERVISFDPTISGKSIEGFKKVLNSTPEKLPERMHMPDEKRYYPWQCVYCAYHLLCLPNAEKTVVDGRYMLRRKETLEERNQKIINMKMKGKKDEN